MANFFFLCLDLSLSGSSFFVMTKLNCKVLIHSNGTEVLSHENCQKERLLNFLYRHELKLNTEYCD